MTFSDPLISTTRLASLLADPALRLLDATVFLHPLGEGQGYRTESGLARWRESHLPGAQFIDLIEEFSAPGAPVRFTMPEAGRFCELAGARGVGDDSLVVIYSSGSPMWATRLWWMFRSVGFERCAVLDGGQALWMAEGRPVTTDVAPAPPVARLTPRPVPARWASRTEVLAAIGQRGVCTLNALSPAVYSGEKNVYGRAGHIPGSHNVFYDSLLDPADGRWRSPEAVRGLFGETGALEAGRVICYCGGGISATMDAFALTRCGQREVAVYDGSMMEWVADPALPLTLGAAP